MFSDSSWELNEKCLHTDGSFICDCNPGFFLTESDCADISECDSDEACSDKFSCGNTSSDFTCNCIDGFEKLDGKCVDIDEGIS